MDFLRDDFLVDVQVRYPVLVLWRGRYYEFSLMAVYSTASASSSQTSRINLAAGDAVEFATSNNISEKSLRCNGGPTKELISVIAAE